jgi:uncharacterized damage-inducible protein DinB
MDPTSSIDITWQDAAVLGFQYHRLLAERAVAQISDEALHQSLDAETNSIAVIMQHVAGNLRSRWTDFLTTDGEKVDRNRDEEFTDRGASRAELLARWDAGWQALIASLEALTPADITRTVLIRGEPHSVPLAVERSLAHTCYHVGQIVLLARHWAGANWQTLTIPRGGSTAHNQAVWNRGDYAKRASGQRE